MYNYLFIVLAVLHVLDSITTYLALKHPTIHELNPGLSYVFSKLGIVPGLVICKGLILGLLFSLYYFGLLSVTVNICLVSFAMIPLIAAIIINTKILVNLAKLET